MPEPRALAGAAAGLLLLHLVLALPSHPQALHPAALAQFQLELPALALLLLAAPFAATRAAVTVALLALTVLKLADLATGTAFLRPFNPVLDAPLLPAGFRLAAGTLGWPLAAAAAIAALALLALLAALLWWATGRLAALAPPRARRAWPALALLPLLAVAATTPGTAPTARFAREHTRDAAEAREALARFRREAALDPYATLSPDRILPALRGTDVLVVFVESYGRSALESPLYAPTATAALREAEPRLAAAGLATRSGFLASPVVGGQSWLAHATLLSGLSVGDEGRYRALLASPRRTLLHLAQAAGWQSVAVMPAITLDWPEASWFGYDRILAAADLGYRGLPFDWVTMPDQFALAAFERQALAPSARPPVFAEIALISSHAPWAPLPPLLPWDDLGDGRVFDPFVRAGETPATVWQSDDRIREHYRRSLDYVLRTVTAFAERRAAARPTLLVVLGDHQPAAFVSGDRESPDVPLHLIGPPDLLARLDGWPLTPGLVPAPSVPSAPMANFRDRFLAAFGNGPPPTGFTDDAPTLPQSQSPTHPGGVDAIRGEDMASQHAAR